MRPRSSLVVVAAGVALLVALDASAGEPTDADRALATSLFKEGKGLLDAGDLAHACPKLEESQRLDPSGGTLLNVALCHEGQGRTATAWTDFNAALAMAKKDGRDDRIKFAEEHLAALEPKLSRLVIFVSKDVDLPSLRIVRDGSEVGRAAWNGPIPVDPGKRTLEFSADGKKKWTTVVEIGAVADSKTVTVPKLEDAPAAASAPAPSRPEVTGSTTSWKVGVALAAAGVAWIGAGSYFGLRAFAKRRESDRECENGCTTRGALLNDDAKVAADASTVSFVVGLASLGVGTYLLLRPTEHAETRSVRVLPAVGPQVGALVVTGRF